MNNIPIENMTASTAWLWQIGRVANNGVESSPRGKPTLEIVGCTVELAMRYPVMSVIERKLSYQFMAAESLWIVSGSNSLNSDVQVRQKLTPYSDDGFSLSGAYGPPYVDQLPYVVQKLKEDPDSRQAVMTIWRPRPYPSKDIPCTVALQFLIRDETLMTNVFMRSSDVWLGLPYDMFTFTIMSTIVALRLRVKNLGMLKIFLGSSHLYKENLDQGLKLLEILNPALSCIPLELDRMSEQGLISTLSYASVQKSNNDAWHALSMWGDLI